MFNKFLKAKCRLAGKYKAPENADCAPWRLFSLEPHWVPRRKMEGRRRSNRTYSLCWRPGRGTFNTMEKTQGNIWILILYRSLKLLVKEPISGPFQIIGEDPLFLWLGKRKTVLYLWVRSRKMVLGQNIRSLLLMEKGKGHCKRCTCEIEEYRANGRLRLNQDSKEYPSQ